MAFQWTDIINNEVADSVRGKINALGQAMMYSVQFFVGSERGTQYLSGNLIVLPFK